MLPEQSHISVPSPHTALCVQDPLLELFPRSAEFHFAVSQTSSLHGASAFPHIHGPNACANEKLLERERSRIYPSLTTNPTRTKIPETVPCSSLSPSEGRGPG